MSQCPQCYTGTCTRHRRQDHGKSKVAMPANSQQTLQKIYDQLVGSKLQKLRAESERDPSAQSAEKFRQELDASRDKSIRKSAAASKRHRSGATSKAGAAATGSGLNPQAFAAIYDGSASSESESDANERSRKKKTKKSKTKKKKDGAASSSSKSSSSKKRKHRKRSRSDESASNSSSEDDDASSDASSSGSDVDARRKRGSSSRKRSSSSRHRSSKSAKKSSKRRRRDSD